MRCRLLLGLLLCFVVIPGNAIGQKNDLEAEFEVLSQLLAEGNCSDAIELLDKIVAEDVQLPYYFYFRGVASNMCGNPKESQRCLEQSVVEFEKLNLKDAFYIDAIYRYLTFLREMQDWKTIADLSSRALKTDRDILLSYPLTYAIYEYYVQALNTIGKWGKVEAIVAEGLPIVEKVLSPTDKAYYNLRIAEIVALTLMNRWSRVSAKLGDLEQINRLYGNGVIDEEIASLSEMVRCHNDQFNWRENADAHIASVIGLAKSLLLKPPLTDESCELWRRFCYTLIDDLELNHYDLNSLQDELYWSKLMACLIVNFGIVCKDMEGRADIAYDIVLLRKNFLDYHAGLLHKMPKRWQDVRNTLSFGELAVEITMCPDEILIVGKEYNAPIAVEIPDSLFSKIEKYTSADAIIINEFYSEGSPLSDIVKLLDPYLDDINTLYISSTNFFSQFNFGAIPYQNQRLEDKYKVVQMTTTADIDIYKADICDLKRCQPILFGGIDYDSEPVVDGACYCSSLGIGKALSDLRSGFGYLPHTLREVEDIKEIYPNALIFKGITASEASLKSVDFSSVPAILHIASHGYTIPQRDYDDNQSDISKIMSIRNRTGILMAGANRSLRGHQIMGDDGILTSQEIVELDLTNVELAVLSSCSSGMGDLTNTTGIVYGVANAMKSGGVKHLIVTLWDVPDEPTAIAMAKIYEEISSGLTPNEAIKCMRKHLIDVGYISPYYWASFVNIE